MEERIAEVVSNYDSRSVVSHFVSEGERVTSFRSKDSGECLVYTPNGVPSAAELVPRI